MNISKTTSLVAILLLAMLTQLCAAYLRFIPQTIYQPDGQKIECFASGDEYHNWLHDKDNYTIIQDTKTGFYCYATSFGKAVIASDLIVGIANPSSRGISPGVNISEEEYYQLRRTKLPMPTERNAPTTGTINNIVIYIRFSDETEFGQTSSTYDGLFNTNTSSLKNYFYEASYGQLTVNTTFYPAASGGYVVSWQDSNPRSYYQPYNATTNPNGYDGDTARRNREFTLLRNATNGVSASIPSNLVIDSDGDGRVDNVVYVVRGSAGAWASLLWPHRWAIYDQYVYIHGKRVYDFNFQLQNHLASSGVGVICHEFFHTLGAPDLYHYTSDGISPAGSWDIMCSDQNPPQHMTAYMKFKYGGWISSIPTISADGDYSLNPLTMPTGNAFRINSSIANQYYVVEFRKKEGTFENSLPGSGLLVYRIDTSASGNADGPPDELYVYRPGGTTSANGNISNANYCIETGRTKINNTTDPTPFLQDGSNGTLAIYNIGIATGATISFTKGLPPEVIWSFATNPHTEGFDLSSFPPDGWQNQIISGSYSFERVTSGTSPTCAPYTGSGMLRYNSYSAQSGQSASLSSPSITIDDPAAYSYNVLFHIYRDSGYSSYADRIEVYVNSDPTLNGNQRLLGTINRSISLSPSVSSTGWYEYSYPLDITSNANHYVILKAISGYGNNIFIDNFRVRRSIKLPIIENLESVVVPNLPASFTKYISSSNSLVKVQTQYSAGISYSYPNYIQLTNSTDISADLRLISPEITSGIAGSRLTFVARGSSTGYTLQIGTMSSTTGVFTLYQTLSLTNVYTQHEINFSNYLGADKYIAFKHGLGGSSRSIYIDDLQISSIQNRDLKVSSCIIPLYGCIDSAIPVNVEVKNSGKLSMSGYRVRLMNADTQSELVGVNPSGSLAPDAIGTHTLEWTPLMHGNYRVYAEVTIATDQDTSNNTSDVLGFTAMPTNSAVVAIGDAATSTTQNSIPFNLYYRNSVTESIFLDTEMQMPDCAINSLVLYYNFTQPLKSRHLKVWMQNTTETNLSVGWLNSANYILVFDGTVDFKAGQHTLLLQFSTPFQYTGTNLALRYNRVMDTEYYSSSNHFYANTNTLFPNRSRYLQSDTANYDPLNPGVSGTLSSVLPQIEFVASNLSLATPIVNIEQIGSNVKLSWQAIRGAKSYLVFESSNPYLWQQLPMTILTGCEYTTSISDRKFYRVQASTDPN